MSTRPNGSARRRTRASFVVRVWDEPTASTAGSAPGQHAGLRGSVHPVAGGAVRYFATLNGLTDAIASSLGLPPGPSSQRSAEIEDPGS